jgi:hypothetical protein
VPPDDRLQIRAVERFVDVVLPRKATLDAAKESFLVIDDQDSSATPADRRFVDWRRRLGSSVAGDGSATRKVVPLPTSEATVSSPSMSVTMR